MSGEGQPDAEPVAILIGDELLDEICREAREAFPAECCGWLTGPRDSVRVTAMRTCSNAQADGAHPTAATRSDETAYVIAGDDLIEFSRSIDSEEPARIIYHSHPNGRAYFSATDAAVAISPWGDGPTYPVQQLVVGIDAEQVTEAALFAWSPAAARFIEVWRAGLGDHRAK